LKKAAVYLILFFTGTFLTFAQIIPEKGVPLLENFTPLQYQDKGKIRTKKRLPTAWFTWLPTKDCSNMTGKHGTF
jgi:hypothetical protein